MLATWVYGALIEPPTSPCESVRVYLDCECHRLRTNAIVLKWHFIFNHRRGLAKGHESVRCSTAEKSYPTKKLTASIQRRVFSAKVDVRLSRSLQFESNRITKHYSILTSLRNCEAMRLNMDTKWQG